MVGPLFADGAGTYINWGVVHVSIANLLIIVLMVVVFFAALLIPFPKPKDDGAGAATTRITDTSDDRGAGR